jgi:hypothetical protein
VSEPGIVSDFAKKAETSGHAQVGNSSIGGSRVIQRWDLVPKKNKGKADVADLSTRCRNRELHEPNAGPLY